MKREKLIEILMEHYSIKTVYAILNGTRKPNYEVMCVLNKNFNIPFTVWKDIKSFVSNETITEQENKKKLHNKKVG